MNENKPVLSVTILEQDRHVARRFSDIHHCLLATAILRVIGPANTVATTPYFTNINGKIYAHEDFKAEDAGFNFATKAPFYTDKAVGKTIYLYAERI